MTVDLRTCLTCGEPAEATEYDSDEDLYRMLCENGHVHWMTDDTETWK